ncbi:LexA family transcriptional regulator [Fusobacterium phage JD-Fnp2]|nr:LexA family transcriptional regulator [Fusobacterium phage JD-Fnp2]UTV61120.1 LexA family transcriptional regulator [Fusobacterium phage JD-Fnp5]
MNTADIIKKRREELGLSQEELAAKLGYKSRSSINKIELGLSDIPFSKIPLFAKALEIEPEILMGWEKNKKQEESNIDMNTVINGDEFVMIPLYSSISAGYGSEEAEFIEMIAIPGLKNPQECFGVIVKGDSMEDKIDSGSTIIVRRDSVIEPGQIGAFSFNNKSYVKQKKVYGNTIVLHSYNDKYEDLLVDEAEEFKEYGKVIMSINIKKF